MAITFPTLEQTKERFRGWYRTFYPTASTAKGSDAWRESQVMGPLGYFIQSRIKAVYAAAFVTTATGDELDKHAEVLFPPDKRRQPATGTTSGEVRFDGVNYTPIPAGTRLVSDDNCIYETADAVAAGDWPGPPLQSVMVDVVSVSTGSSCNKAAAERLTLVSPISGIDDEVVVTVALDGARDKETDDELRGRLLDWLRYPPGGGNWGHYLNFAQGVGGCAKAYVYPLYRGLGTVDVVVMGPGITDDNPTGDRFSADEVAVDAYLRETMLPATVQSLDVSDPVEQAEPVDIDVEPVPGYEPDYVHAGFDVSAIEPVDKKRITVNADPSITDGNRILLNVQVGGVWVPCLREVEAVTVGPPHYIHVSSALPSSTHDPTLAGLKPAGPGTQEQVEAILSLFDGLTPGDTEGGTRRPRVSPDEPTDLLLADIFDEVQSLVSVLNMSITLPAGDVTPSAAKNLIRNERIYITYV